MRIGFCPGRGIRFPLNLKLTEQMCNPSWLSIQTSKSCSESLSRFSFRILLMLALSFYLRNNFRCVLITVWLESIIIVYISEFLVTYIYLQYIYLIKYYTCPTIYKYILIFVPISCVCLFCYLCRNFHRFVILNNYVHYNNSIN